MTSIAALRRSLDVPWDIPRRDNGRSKLPIRPGADWTWSRVRRRPKLRLLDLLEQQGEGAVEDRGWIAVRDLTAEKGLEVPQPLVALLADRELDAVALERGGLDDPAARRQ
ncbi:MAG: hypothetical protein DMF77_13935 [Acidobacteria bacterium]|nr:MAG: hypothetical protein DMF77_13935 [Acidobacteriota bacterium]